MQHPTTTKERLMNKILSNMMLTCKDRITQQQVENLQKFKDSPAEFDSTQAEYSSLLNFDLNHYIPDPNKPEAQQQVPIELNQAEINMQTIVEVSQASNSLGLKRGNEERKGGGNERTQRSSFNLLL